MKKKWISNTISLKYHNWDLIEDICQHLFRQWLCAEQATGHCPNQWWLTRLAPICVAWMKSFEFLIWFHWNMFIGVYWKYVSIGPDDCLMTNGQQAIIWASHSLIYWRIYASFQLRHFLFHIKISKKCVHLGIVENMLVLDIGANNGLAPIRRHGIIWTNDGRVYRPICVIWLKTYGFQTKCHIIMFIGAWLRIFLHWIR